MTIKPDEDPTWAWFCVAPDVPAGKPWPVAWCAGRLPDRTPNDVAQKPQTSNVKKSSRVVIRPWRGASYRYWNDDFWLEKRAIFSSYRTPRILTNEIHTLAVKILVGILTSCWQLPWNDPLLSKWPWEFPRVKIWRPEVTSLGHALSYAHVLNSNSNSN